MDRKGKVIGCMCEGRWGRGFLEHWTWNHLTRAERDLRERREDIFVGRLRNTLSCLNPYSSCPFLNLFCLLCTSKESYYKNISLLVRFRSKFISWIMGVVMNFPKRMDLFGIFPKFQLVFGPPSMTIIVSPRFLFIRFHSVV